MERVASSHLLLLLLFFLLCILSSESGGFLRDQNQNSQVLEAALIADLSAVLHRVDPRFLSVTIDASLAADEKFMSLLRWVLSRATELKPALQASCRSSSSKSCYCQLG